MIVNINDLEFNNENLKKHIESLNSPRGLKTIKKRDDMLMIDWTDIDMSRIDISKIDKDIVLDLFQSENLSNIKNRDFFGLLFKTIELKNEEYLWVQCVDMNRIISNEFYLLNSYDENLDLLFRYYSRTK